MNDINLYNSTNPPTLDTVIKPVTMPRGNEDEPLESINMGALLFEPLTLQFAECLGGEMYTGEVRHFGLNRSLKIELWGRDMALIESALNIKIGDRHDFNPPLEIQARQYVGKKFKGIKLIPNLTPVEDTVATPTPKPESIDTTVYKYHGETVTIESAKEKGRGDYKIWQLECRADDESLIRIEAWSEVNRMIQEAGYPALPARGAAKITVNADAIVEYNAKHDGYRIKYIYPKNAPVLTVVEEPVRVVIPVTIEPTWEDELRQLRAMIDKMLLATDEMAKLDKETGNED